MNIDLGQVPKWIFAFAALLLVGVLIYALVWPGVPVRLGSIGVIGRAEANTEGVPPGAVIAFNRGINEAACPDGWERFAAADGRVIVGAGGVSDQGVEVYPAFKDDPAKGHGGSDRAKFEVTIKIPADDRWGSDKDHGSTPWAAGPNPARGGATVSGTGEIDNRQPFVALFFCTKK